MLKELQTQYSKVAKQSKNSNDVQNGPTKAGPTNIVPLHFHHSLSSDSLAQNLEFWAKTPGLTQYIIQHSEWEAMMRRY